MALYQETFIYEILARFTPEGLQGCQQVTGVRIWDDAQTPHTLVSESLQSAVALTKDEAADILHSAVLIIPPDQLE